MKITYKVTLLKSPVQADQMGRLSCKSENSTKIYNNQIYNQNKAAKI